MKITTIKATAARGFNHPYEQFANFKFDLTLEADVEPGEDPEAAIAALQKQVESKAEAHKAAILGDVERKRQIAEVADAITYEKRKAFDNEASKRRLAELEEKLTLLTAQPLLLSQPVIHPGHPDHPATDADSQFAAAS